ncbi:MAG: phosphotransferase [Chloroflexi bacterium]|nr:phosphotransferase [Chloroflexota bacterium]
MPEFAKIIDKFCFEGEYIGAHPYGFGHINDTYAARFKLANGKQRRYVIQRINHYVFKRPEYVMHNIEQVTGHLRKKIIAADGDPNRETITIIPTKVGRTYHKTTSGNYWRANSFIEGAQTYQKAVNLDHYYHAARAFGAFMWRLGDLPPDSLYETIPDFHNTPKRFHDFIEALEKDPANRAQSVKPEIDFTLSRANETGLLMELVKQGEIPERVTHNDTKFDNVMIDDVTGEGICVVDLDTVMPGTSAMDFGDSVRTGANPAAEDEQDLSKVYLDLEIFDRLAHGFLFETRDLLTPTEIQYLAFGAKLITLEQGIRFLTDHINGDIYYKVHRQDHNLDRCRAQYKLLSDVEGKFDSMLAMIEVHRQI